MAADDALIQAMPES